MTALSWDKTGERTYQTGVDRGVLYLGAGGPPGVPWNGLTSVEETFEREIKPYYLDGVKYLETQVVGDYTAHLKAFTYPDYLDHLTGVRPISPSGVYAHEQTGARFGLSYRTMIGNDTESLAHGYRIHIVYNVLATPDNQSFETLDDAPKPFEFGWVLRASPVLPSVIPAARPTAHISINSTQIDPALLQVFENTLYGTEETEPTLPTLADLLALEVEE